MAEHALTGFSGIDQPHPSIYDTCIRCGLCLPSCPTYLETMTETSGPRGRDSLIKSVGESRLNLLSFGFVEQMWQCLDCRACEAVCPPAFATASWSKLPAAKSSGHSVRTKAPAPIR